MVASKLAERSESAKGARCWVLLLRSAVALPSSAVFRQGEGREDGSDFETLNHARNPT